MSKMKNGPKLKKFIMANLFSTLQSREADKVGWFTFNLKGYLRSTILGIDKIFNLT